MIETTKQATDLVQFNGSVTNARVVVGSTGWTALQSYNANGTIYRLQLTQAGTLQLLESTDDGATWPNDRRVTIASLD